ncbi:hypothetical protein MIND_00609800 [Mycena indigotica]|uniref:Uncharacterized protein n=1 Tax=Mycena indigotica TaxID=2126181 RepID=A0A8H6SQT8_9AGAR|nr:uncharacterized protein MIND_00609800 [Mycena indigotica]KAF7303801.1 hypothetical protein MIND_00609800 [Mycena indigotica]
MAFLRKKRSQVDPPPLIRSPPPVSNVAPPPLYARFATSPTNDAHPRVVSSPMALGAGQRNAAGQNGAMSRQQQGYTQPNYGPPPPNRRISAAVSADKPLPDPHFGQPSHAPPNRRTSAYNGGPPQIQPPDGPYRASGPSSPPPRQPTLVQRLEPDSPQLNSRLKTVAQPEIRTDMGATISSLQVQSFHPSEPAFKALIPAQPVQSRSNVPKRSPSGLVKGKPLIFAAMEPENADDVNNNNNFYSSPPIEPARSPPPLLPPQQRLPTLAHDTYDPFDAGFSKNVLQSINWSEQPLRQPVQTPRPLPRINNPPLPPQPPKLPPSLQTQLPPAIPQSPPRVIQQPVQHVPSLPSLSSPSSPPPPSSPVPHTPRTLTKPRPTTPQRKQSNAALQLPTTIDRDDASSRASTLMLDDDPFAKVEPIRMLKPASRDGIPQSPSFPPVEDQSLPEPVEEVQLPERPVTPKVPSELLELLNITPPKPRPPPSPVTPEEYRTARSQRRGDQLGRAPPASLAGIAVKESRIPGPFPLVDFILDAQLLSALLEYLSFYEWCVLSAITKALRSKLVGTKDLREVALERFLRTVGYAKWAWEPDNDPLELSLLDLHDYMRGVSLPSHEHARIGNEYVQSFNFPPAARDPTTLALARNLTMSTRAYSRVVLRLRAQAEREASEMALLKPSNTLVNTRKRFTNNGYTSNRSSPSRGSSRPPSPSSLYSGHAQPPQPALTFRSPLFRLKRAPLLRVFVPSPDGDWLSDKSVLECEAELKRAGVLGLLRAGDVVWDIAVGDEGNVGRLVWDGSYLIDLDYKYSTVGDLPQYLPTLAFPPSYFHRVIRTGADASNPIAHVDIAPWGQEIAANLQLLQDRIRTETPQGNVHNVVRWVHRSSFVIRAPGKARLYVDSGWYGTIVVETEGTNEALADLQDRCPGAFPPRAGGPHMLSKEAKEAKKVFRILREKSRPSEIWIRAVSPKERLL